MTNTEKLDMLKTLLRIDNADTSDNNILTTYLTSAEKEIIAWRFSYTSGEMPTTVPVEYEMIQIHAVIAGYSINGAENQTAHSENGISRTFKYEDMVSYIHAHVIPYCKVV